MIFLKIFFVLGKKIKNEKKRKQKKTNRENKMKRNASKRDAGVSVGPDTDQSFRVCKVDLATLKVAITSTISFLQKNRHIHN